MAFLVFRRTRVDGSLRLRPQPADPASPLIVLDKNRRFKYNCESFQLGGRHLIYEAWELRGRPLGEGWSVSADQLIKLHKATESDATRGLIIDFDPNSRYRIGLVELLDIRAYTHRTEPSNQASYTPLMLRLRDVYYREREQGEPEITPEEKACAISDLPEPASNRDFLSFRYLNGDRLCWNWGKNGATSAAFVQSGAREYFRQFF